MPSTGNAATVTPGTATPPESRAEFVAAKTVERQADTTKINTRTGPSYSSARLRARGDLTEASSLTGLWTFRYIRAFPD